MPLVIRDSMKSIYLLILSLIFVSGCTGLPNVFGGDVISLQKTVVTENPRDAVVVPSIVTLPSPPFLPNQGITISMLVENQDKLKDARNVKVDLFNAPTFKSASTGELCNRQSSGAGTTGSTGSPDLSVIQDSDRQHVGTACSDNAGNVIGVCRSVSIQECPGGIFLPGRCPGSSDIRCCTGSSSIVTPSPTQTFVTSAPNTCQPDLCGPTGPFCTLLPGEQKQIRFQLKAPSESEIANIQTKTSLDIKTNYDFDGSLVYITPVVNVDEIVRLQTQGKRLTVEESKLQGSGPILIDVELLGAPYILSGSDPNTPPQKSIMTFTIKNTGRGSLLNSIIETSNINPGTVTDLDALRQQPGNKGLVIIFPREFVQVRPSSDNFNCAGTPLGTVCVNTKDILVFKDQSRVSMRFEIQPAQLPPGTPFRSYTTKAFVWYNYELRDMVEVTINPFQNV